MILTGYNTFQTKRQMCENIRAQLDLDRSTFMPVWREVSDYILPRRARFTLSEANRGDRRNQKIIDSTGTLALRTLRSGMASGITNKARPWFRLTTPDPDLAEQGSVKEWLHEVTQRMLSILIRSNFYRSMGPMYDDLGGFGTSVVFVERDMDRVIHTQNFPIGSYWLGSTAKGRINIFYHEFRMTVRQLVETFGGDVAKPDWEKFSIHVRKAWEENHREQWVDVCHIIMPNAEYDPNKGLSRYKKFHSCYFEKGTQSTGTGTYLDKDDDTYLSEMGYDYFPVLCPRWSTTGEDVYGTSCPGIDMIGDVKALQLMQKRKAEAIEKLVRPPMTAPSSMKTTKASILPGDISYVDEVTGQGGFKPAYQVDPRIGELTVDINDHQQRIRRAGFEDVFLMISQDEKTDRTAFEIAERKEEKLILLGPVMESIDEDVLDPFFDILFFEMNAQGLLPDPPQDLQGQELKVEYLSVMHQAQKLVGVGGMERFLSNMTAYAGNLKDPTVMDKIDMEEYVDVYGDALSVNPRIIRSDDKVKNLKAARAKEQQANAMAERAQMAAGAAKDLSGADMEGDNALTRLAQGGQGQVVQ